MCAICVYALVQFHFTILSLSALGYCSYRHGTLLAFLQTHIRQHAHNSLQYYFSFLFATQFAVIVTGILGATLAAALPQQAELVSGMRNRPHITQIRDNHTHTHSSSIQSYIQISTSNQTHPPTNIQIFVERAQSHSATESFLRPIYICSPNQSPARDPFPLSFPSVGVLFALLTSCIAVVSLRRTHPLTSLSSVVAAIASSSSSSSSPVSSPLLSAYAAAGNSSPAGGSSSPSSGALSNAVNTNKSLIDQRFENSFCDAFKH